MCADARYVRRNADGAAAINYRKSGRSGRKPALGMTSYASTFVALRRSLTKPLGVKP